MITISTLKMILASGSPRRREILAQMGYDFKTVSPDLDESLLDGESPDRHVMRLSSAKAKSVADKHPDDLVIGADTIVVLGNRILGKPSSPDEAIEMLHLLSGKAHVVYTGLSLIILSEKLERTGYDATKVIFNTLEDNSIRSYVESGEPLDKAGAYGIQGMGSFLVNHYEGEFDTVIGFPTKLFSNLFAEVTSCRNR
jgi:septum formation protein